MDPTHFLQRDSRGNNQVKCIVDPFWCRACLCLPHAGFDSSATAQQDFLPPCCLPPAPVWNLQALRSRWKTERGSPPLGWSWCCSPPWRKRREAQMVVSVTFINHFLTGNSVLTCNFRLTKRENFIKNEHGEHVLPDSLCWKTQK